MTLLDWLHNKWNITSFVLINLMDSSILVLLVYPFLYFLTFKPLITQIKERTRMAGIIKQSEEEWDTIFNSITDMVSIHDSNFIIKKANESFLKFTGMNRDDVTGRRCYTLVHGTNQPFCNCPHERCLQSREHEILEIEDERTSLSLLVSVSPVFDKDGNFLYSVHIAKDISELKQVEKELRVKSYILERMNKNLTIMVDEEVKKRRQQEQLLIQQSKQASMGEVVGMIAHQWKQPLNAISLTVEDLQEASDFGEIDKDYVRRANKAVMQQVGFMSKTIDDFRTFLIPSRTQRSFDIKKAIEDIVGMFGSLYKKK
ncbi:MAG: PAS domain S-box protein, partial [Nitrospirae bacterium]|nr:PAS domain S-box protein [Nitrospirota bacterium]